jgi:hypothetical protein
MSRQAKLLCLAAVTFSAACADDSTAPVVTPTVTRPSFAPGGNSSSKVGFVSLSAALNPSPTLAVSYTIAGVLPGQTIEVYASAQTARTDACVNGGENVTKKKITSENTVLASGLAFTATVPGDVVGVILLPFPDSPLDCPSGQVATFMGGFWSDVAVTANIATIAGCPPQTICIVVIGKTSTGTYPVSPADRIAAIRSAVVEQHPPGRRHGHDPRPHR